MYSAMIISDITSKTDRSYCQLSENVDNNQDLEGHPDIDYKEDDSSKDEQVERVSVKNFDAKYPSRAHLNIYTPREATRKLLECVEESFENELVMYYYTDI